MKKLILLFILISNLSFGQNIESNRIIVKIIHNKDTSIAKSGEIIINLDKKLDYGDLIVLMDYWEEYKQKCYNDSIVIGYRYIISEEKDSYGSSIVWYSDDPSCNYIRKEPIKELFEQPTFEGYMNYLETKLNE